MEIIKSILTLNPCYNIEGNFYANKPTGLMLHSVGCPQPSASVFVNSWNNINYGNACVHGFIDANSGNVYQTLPWEHKGWHGGGSSNKTHVGIEMCEPDCITYDGIYVNCSDVSRAKKMISKTYNAAVDLFAMLCTKFDLDPLKKGVVVSHSEGYKLGIATNHGDPEHLWNALGTGYTMDGFRRDVKNAMSSVEKPAESKPISVYRVRKSWDDPKSQIGAFSYIENAIAACKIGHTVYDPDGNAVYPELKEEPTGSEFKVRVDIDDLYIRTGAGIGYTSVGFCPKGIYTIVEVQNGRVSKEGHIAEFGRLKSGAGWVCMDYVERM